MTANPKYVSELRPKPCKGHKPLGDPRDGTCVLCGRRPSNMPEPAPTSAESLWEILNR